MDTQAADCPVLDGQACVRDRSLKGVERDTVVDQLHGDLTVRQAGRYLHCGRITLLSAMVQRIADHFVSGDHHGGDGGDWHPAGVKMGFESLQQLRETGAATGEYAGEVRYHTARPPTEIHHLTINRVELYLNLHDTAMRRQSWRQDRTAPMDISEETRGGVLVVTASGRLDSNTAGVLQAVLPTRVQSNPATILDLAEMAYVSSAGLRVLLIAAKAARSNGHRLVLTGLSDSVREVFDISGFTTIFTIEADVDSGLAALA